MKYYIIAGEASGDLHAHNLVKAISEKDDSATFRGIGGEKMETVGVQLDQRYEDIAYMGFAEVVKHLPTILGAIKICKQNILDYQPDALILVDYPGFNLRIAKWAKGLDIAPIYYYISPQVWAWKSNRVYDIRDYADKLYCILPFEKDFYADRGVEVEYVGHPLLDEIESFRPNPAFFDENGLRKDREIMALLPGSRKQEISKKLPVMMEAAKEFADEYQIIIAGAPGMQAAFYESIIGKKDSHVIYGQTYDLLSNASRAIVTSGTATLETALFSVPEVVCYITSRISYEIGKRLVDIDYISLVNLIMGREIVTELVQNDCTSESIVESLRKLDDPVVLERLKKDYLELRTKLLPGASERTADKIYQDLLAKKGMSA